MKSKSKASSLALYHYWRSSASWRVRWALGIKGLSYDSRPVNIVSGEQRDPTYQALNPSGLVPCLVVDGKAMGESVAIMEWLEEKFPVPTLLPQDAATRQLVRQASMMVVAGIQPLANLAPQYYFSSDPEARSRWARHWIQTGLVGVEALLGQHAGTYAIGGQITMADLCLIPQAYNALRFEVSLEQFPTIKRIYEHCMKDEICYKASPFGQPERQPKT